MSSNMKRFISKRVEDIPFSGIRKFFDIASEMEDVISLGVGEPDFSTPMKARAAGIENLTQGNTKYTSNAGLLPLREEIRDYLSRRFQVEYNAKDQIFLTVGASEGIDVALRTLIEPGDEVLYAEPCYVSYRPCIILAGGVPVEIETKAENQFKITAEELLEKITDKTKVLLMSYPSNPTGAIMEKEDLEKIAQVIIEKDIMVISDEIYAELTYGGRQHVSVAATPGLYERTILLSGFSKAFAMTGWRLGYAAGPEDIIKQMLKVHQYVIMCAPTTSQYAAVEALRSCYDSVIAMRDEYDARRKVMVEGFRRIGLDVFEPLGAFYVFPSIQSTGLTSEQFCEQLLHAERVAVVPGDAFGACGAGFIRCSYAYSIENIQEALRRIEKFLKTL